MSLPKSKQGQLSRDNKLKDIKMTETYKEDVVFYASDTKTQLSHTRCEEALKLYKCIAHEVTLLI